MEETKKETVDLSRRGLKKIEKAPVEESKTIINLILDQNELQRLKAEWLYSQGKGRHFHSGQHQELCEYLASTCPLTADALETEDQRKLRLILSKAQHHQQQLKDQNHSPLKSKLQSPRMQSRITPRHMGRSPDRLTSSYHAALSKTSSPSHQMSSSLCGDLPGIHTAMSQSFDSPGLLYMTEKRDKEREKIPEPVPQPKPMNHSLEAASKMVPVPESLMSPDYQDPIYDIQRSIPKPVNHSVNSISNTSSQSSNSSIHEDKPRQHNQAKNLKGSPKLPKSAMSSPKLKTKMDQRKGSLTKLEFKNDDKKLNGMTSDNTNQMSDIMKLASNQRRQKKMSVESMAAVTIQKMWRGYRSRNLNKDTLRILHAIQAARARQHIQRLTCDMEATKAALESERKIQQLQMQAINALWKKVSTLQATDNQKPRMLDPEDNTDVLRQLTETCFSLQAQVVELQSCMQEVLKAVSNKGQAEGVGTQTDITAIDTPQEERGSWLRRPQSLPLAVAEPRDEPAHKPRDTDLVEKSSDSAALGIERTESVIEEQAEPNDDINAVLGDVIVH
ncbi:unnamed protein product [Arctia plantaginis]|uniref:Uncharacterized protein n=1 Tax=Arctia plantaginis TaxID=874455 RepID=A0A8S1A8V2_ARCPL|nr:unnamed protein product [Arctia plantaginis]